jgi:hypothetical protein
VSTVVIDNMLKGFQDENTDPAKVHIVPGLASDYTVNEHRLLRFHIVFIDCFDKCGDSSLSFSHLILAKIMVFINK